MKTTVNLPDPLLDRARALASRDGVTFTELLEVSLRREVERREASAPGFVLEAVTVAGEGVREEIEEGRWFELIYGEQKPGS